MSKKKAILWARHNLGPAMQHQPNWLGAFSRGLIKHNWKIILEPIVQECDLFCIWGTRRKEIIKEAKQKAKTVCVIERGFIGDRFENCMVGLNGKLNGYADYPWSINKDETRFNSKFKDLMKPWKGIHNNLALLIGQVGGDASIKHLNADEWYVKTARELQKNGWSVLFRPHPQNRRSYPQLERVQRVGGNLYENLDKVSLVVTMNSNVSVDAMLYGVPTVTTDPGSMVHEVTLPHIPEYKNKTLYSENNMRKFRLYELAWKQFNKQEMESGFVLDTIKDYI